MASTIAQGTIIKGRVSGDGDLEVHGHVEGSIEVAGDLSVGSTGLVKSDLRGRRVAVAGAVKGDLIASDALVLEAGARVVGDLVAPSIAVREGALVRGRITTGEIPTGAGAAKPREAVRTAVSAGRERASAALRPALRQESPRASRPAAASAPAKPAPAAPPPAAAAAPAPAPQPAPKAAAETPRAAATKQAPPPPVVPALKRRTEKVKRKGG